MGSLEKTYLIKAIDSGFVSTVGPFVDEFEKQFSKYLHVPRAVAMQSGTSALYMALHELGVGKGDEVIVPALTFAATVNPVLQLGATPVIVDVDKETWSISPEAVERYITRKTKVIIPVHLFGNPCDMRRLGSIAHTSGLSIIEDATESLGATYGGKQTGSLGDFGCFSFNGNKIITTGGGGMLTSRKTAQLKHIKYMINQAKSVANNAVYHYEIGFNYRMTNIEAAMGLAQMQRLSTFLSKKRAFHEQYENQLSSVETISFQKEYPSAKSSWWFTGIILARENDMKPLQTRLARKNIPTRRFFVPLTDCLPYKKFQRGSVANAQYLFNHGLCLPSSTSNTSAAIDRVVTAVRAEIIGRK